MPSLDVFLGEMPAVAQVWKGTIGSNTLAQTFILTLTDVDVGGTVALTYTVTAADAAGSATDVATNLAAQWNADPRRQFKYITASTNGAQVILTADTAGQPFSVAQSGTGTWSGTGVTTSSSGPFDYGLAGNWSLGAIPVATDDVLVPAGRPVRYSLNQASVAIGKFETVGGAVEVGRDEGEGVVFSLKIDPDVCELRASSGMIAVDIGSAAIDVLVEHDGSGVGGLPAVYVNGTAIVDVDGWGDIGVAAIAGQTGTVTGVFRFRSGSPTLGGPLSSLTVTGTSLHSRDAKVKSWVSVPTVTQYREGAEWWQMAGSWTTGTFYDGKVYPMAEATYATTTLDNDAVLDCMLDMRPKTFTTVARLGRSKILSEGHGQLTFTNGVSQTGAKGGYGWGDS